METQTIFSYIKSEETKFETQDIQIADNWYWNFRKHIQIIFHLKHSQFYTGENDFTRAFKQIMNPMIDLANWTEDIEVKDATFYIEGQTNRVVSFFIKKYHENVYAKKHNLDELYDKITESDNIYGGVLIQDGMDVPEVIELKKICFCDQTNILGGPIGFKFYFSPDKLKTMKSFGWGKTENGADITIDELCILAKAEKDPSGNQGNKNQVTGKQIEVYIVKGEMLSEWLNTNETEDTVNQVQIVAFYTKKDGQKQGVTLYKKKDNSELMFFTSQEVEDRGLGLGVGEKMLQPQVWTNLMTINKMGILEAGSKIVLYTDDTTFTNKNKIQDMDNLEVATVDDGKRIAQIPTIAPANIQLYERAVDEWYSQAQLDNSAQDSLLGKEESAGTTFRGQERLIQQGKGPHDRKRGKRAKFIEELYRKKIIPQMKKDMLRNTKFIADLDNEEMEWVVDQLSINMARKKVIDRMFSNIFVSKEEQDILIQEAKKELLKKGNKFLIKILKEELKDAEINIGINIAGKQKNLAGLTDKILSVFQFVFTNPQAFMQSMKIPALARAFNDKLELNGKQQ
jgi:hypothetical protein